MRTNRYIVAVIGSGIRPHKELSIPLGRWLAKRGYDLVNGGGAGVMEETAKAFAGNDIRTGLVLGILPSDHFYDKAERRNIYRSPHGYPNKYIDIPIRTHLPLSGSQGKEVLSRNHIIILTANVIVALPGELGTRSEIQLALEYRKPLIILSPNKEWDEYKNSSALIVKDVKDVFTEIQKKIGY